MTDVIKVLAQASPEAVTATLFYTAPALSSVTISTLTVCNRTASPDTFRISIRQGGAAEDNKQYLYYDTSIAGNTTLNITIGMTLAESDQIYVYVSAVGVSFNLFGVETS